MMDHDEYLREPAHIISGAFEDYQDAEEATAHLLAEDFPADRLSVLLGEETRQAYLDIHPEVAESEQHVLAQTVHLDQESKALKGAGVGGTVGGTLGAAAGAVAAIGSAIAIPPLGIVVAGPLAMGLAGAGAGGAAGTLVGALTGAGMSELRARRLEEFLRDGDVIVTVRAVTQPERNLATEIIEKHGGVLVESEETVARSRPDEGP